MPITGRGFRGLCCDLSVAGSVTSSRAFALSPPLQAWSPDNTWRHPGPPLSSATPSTGPPAWPPLSLPIPTAMAPEEAASSPRASGTCAHGLCTWASCLDLHSAQLLPARSSWAPAALGVQPPGLRPWPCPSVCTSNASHGLYIQVCATPPYPPPPGALDPPRGSAVCPLLQEAFPACLLRDLLIHVGVSSLLPYPHPGLNGLSSEQP